MTKASLFLIITILFFTKNSFSKNRWQYDNFNFILYDSDVECNMKNIFSVDIKDRELFLKKYKKLTKNILKNRIKLCYYYPVYKSYMRIKDCENNQNDEICEGYGKKCNGVIKNCLDIWHSIENWEFSDIGYESYLNKKELQLYCRAKRECSKIIQEVLRLEGKID